MFKNFYHWYIPTSPSYLSLSLYFIRRVPQPWFGVKVTSCNAISANMFEKIIQKFGHIIEGVLVEEVCFFICFSFQLFHMPSWFLWCCLLPGFGLCVLLLDKEILWIKKLICRFSLSSYRLAPHPLKKKRNFVNAVFFNESFDRDQNPKVVMPSKIEV